MTHELKTINPHFQAVWDEEKTFEVRQNDRGFEVGDFLVLKEFDPASELYTGRDCRVEVTSILYGGQYGISSDYCVMSIHVLTKFPLIK